MTIQHAYPAVVTVYTAASPAALNRTDTESQFVLDGPSPDPLVDNAVKYTLPGLPLDIRIVPIERLLTVVSSSGGTAIIGPPDYNKQPFPLLGDFRGVFLKSIGDFARVLWTGTLWTVVETGGPTVAVADPRQVPL